MIKNVVFVKIHRCSSTTVRYIIEDFADKNNLTYPFKGQAIRFNDIPIQVPKLRKKYNLFTRHKIYDKDFFESVIDSPAYVSFVRDPLERAISHHYGLSKSASDFNEWYPENYKVRKNYMSKFLGYNSIKDITKKNLESRYIFIGTTESFDRSIKLMGKTLGWNIGNNYKKYNITNREKHMSEKTKKLFKKHNQADYKLYKLVKEIWLNTK